MIAFPAKRIIGLIGEERVGKDEVARYLIETRGFISFAFADQIKEECGISKEDFETAKISGKIGELRQKLWDFSEEKKAIDPLYFIKNVMDKALNSDKSVVLTDIRTPDEFNALYSINNDVMHRAYWIRDNHTELNINGVLSGSKLPISLLIKHNIKVINNYQSGLYNFYRQLDGFFFNEDIVDLIDKKIDKKAVLDYVNQFRISWF